MSTTNPTSTVTEWEALQVKYGNLPERPKEITQEELTGIAIDFAEAQDPRANLSLNELKELEGRDSDEDNAIEKCRQARLEELKKKKERFRFGELCHIRKSEFIREINEASKENWVVLHLYREGTGNSLASALLNQRLAELAPKFGDVKFVKAISTEIIEGFPDSNLPAVLLYRDGVCKRQLFGPAHWGADGKGDMSRVTAESVEYRLSKLGVLVSDIESDPLDEDDKTKGGSTRTSAYYSSKDLYSNRERWRKNGDSDKSESDDDRCYSSTRIGLGSRRA